MRAVARARAFFGVGVEFERVWLPRLRDLNPDMVVQHTDHGLDTIPMQAHGHGHGHDEDHGGDHAEGRPDPHVWLSPDNARHIARAVRDGLARVDPGNAATYQANLERVLGEIGELDATLTQWLAPVRGEGFLVFHPTWGYLAREYGLEQLAIQAQGREPGPRQLAAVIETARERGIRTVFVQPQFSAATARVVAKALDGEVVTADPLAADWKDNLLHVGRALRNALETR
jgi:zinc transport system substrate-binding protein